MIFRYTYATHVNDIISIITRAIFIFILGEGEDCYEQSRSDIQAEVKKGCRLLLFVSKVYFLHIQYTYHARLQSLFAHNHAALKSHKVHDRVLHWEITVCVLPLRAAIYFIILLPPPFCVRIIKFIVPPVLFDDTLLFIPPCLLWTLCWLGCFSLFFFGFVVALVLCVKPAPEQQRLDDAIGFLRDHAEVRTAEFQFFF